MSRKYRTDPLDRFGKVDYEFFASPEYENEQKRLISYLEMEGFIDFDMEFFIDFFGRKWHVYSVNKSKKK